MAALSVSKEEKHILLSLFYENISDIHIPHKVGYEGTIP